jgi:hypothetical protein
MGAGQEADMDRVKVWVLLAVTITWIVAAWCWDQVTLKRRLT